MNRISLGHRGGGSRSGLTDRKAREDSSFKSVSGRIIIRMLRDAKYSSQEGGLEFCLVRA
jgi:hypothetical protein